MWPNSTVRKGQPAFCYGKEVKETILEDVEAIGSLLTTHLEIRGQKERVWENGQKWGIDLG